MDRDAFFKEIAVKHRPAVEAYVGVYLKEKNKIEAVTGKVILRSLTEAEKCQDEEAFIKLLMKMAVETVNELMSGVKQPQLYSDAQKTISQRIYEKNLQANKHKENEEQGLTDEKVKQRLGKMMDRHKGPDLYGMGLEELCKLNRPNHQLVSFLATQLCRDDGLKEEQGIRDFLAANRDMLLSGILKGFKSEYSARSGIGLELLEKYLEPLNTGIQQSSGRMRDVYSDNEAVNESISGIPDIRKELFSSLMDKISPG